MIQLHNGECLEFMSTLNDNSVDMILCDLPFGTTSCKWDSVIDLQLLWGQYNRIIKPNGAIVVFGSQPFTSAIIMSNIKKFKYTWTWLKRRPTGFQNAKKMPLRQVEDVIVFNSKRYFPQGLERVGKVCKNSKTAGGGVIRDDVEQSSGKGSLRTAGKTYVQEFTNYPKNVLEFGHDEVEKLHPTQKPVALLEYLIKTYTLEGEIILDNCFGSGSTAIAAINTNRSFIGCELDEGYFNIAKQRISTHLGDSNA